MPPVKGFWSLTLYNSHHFFSPNEQNRYSLGTKNKELKYNDDGSLTIYVQSSTPGADKADNWLPAPANEDFSLYVRAYWPNRLRWMAHGRHRRSSANRERHVVAYACGGAAAICPHRAALRIAALYFYEDDDESR